VQAIGRQAPPDHRGRAYLLLIQSERVEGRIKQRVLLRLGRLDQLQASGHLDRLLVSPGPLLGQARGDSITTRTRSIGAALIFERLWTERSVRCCAIGASSSRWSGRCSWLRRRDTTSATALQVVDSEEVCPAWCGRWVRASGSVPAGAKRHAV
jgi:hypothetical protein